MLENFFVRIRLPNCVSNEKKYSEIMVGYKGRFLVLKLYPDLEKNLRDRKTPCHSNNQNTFKNS